MTRTYRPKKSTLMILSGLLLITTLFCQHDARLVAALIVSSVSLALWGCVTEGGAVMIEKRPTGFTPVCDTCGSELPECQEHADAVLSIRANGWVARRDYKDEDGRLCWRHYCDECLKIIMERR